MSYQLKIIKDNPIGFWTLDETSGTTAIDKSGCGNNGTYTGGLTSGVMPLIPGGILGTSITNSKSIVFPITKDYYGSTAGGGIADKYSTDNDFTIEAWIYPKITTTNETPLFADTTNTIGMYYHKGNILFKIGGQRIDYTIPYIKKSHYIAAVYSVDGIRLYCDGYLVNSKVLENKITLSNTSTTFSAGPTLNASDSFIIDAPAVYRYSLTPELILAHYNAGQPIATPQIVTPENGVLFSLNDENLKKSFVYSYPVSKSWENFVNEDIVFNSQDQSISILATDTVVAKTVEFTDYITFPTTIGIEFSKIEWSSDNGVTVETSIDGTTYVACTNGESIPQYQFGSFDSSGKIYIKFTLSTTDASKYIPKLKYLAISLFKSKDLPADNYGDRITYSQDEYHLGNKNYNTLSRDYRNGLRCKADNGFVLNTATLIKTIEFFYTPSALTDSGLVSSVADTEYSASNFSWRNSGTISKTNISAIYVNGVNKTSETNISNVFTAGELHHVVIVYIDPISDDITFNYSLYGAVEALYKNIAIYPDQFNSNMATLHYNLYTERAAEAIDINPTSVTVTEIATPVYNNDWIVVQSS